MIRKIDTRIFTITAYHMPFTCKQFPYGLILAFDDDELTPCKTGLIRRTQIAEYIDNTGLLKYAAIFLRNKDICQFADFAIG